MTGRVTYWCELAWLGGPRAERSVVVAVGSGRVLDVAAGRPPPLDAIRLAGLTLPGLANTHSHAFHRVLRSRAQRPQSFWQWREVMYGVAEALDPDRFFRLARAVFAEMASAGITVVGEFHYVHHTPTGAPYADPNEMGHRLVAAARAAGVRLTLLDTCYLTGDVDEPVSGAQVRFSDGDAHRWAARVGSLRDDGTVRVGAAAHSVRGVPPDAIATVAAWAAARDAPLHAHLSEQRVENERAVARWQRTPTEVFADAGALGDRFTAVHATHATETDIALLGDAGATCCLCPTTERDLGDGIGPAAALVGAGAHLAVGTDSNAMIDPFEEIRAVELDERLSSGTRGRHQPEDLLAAATASGYAALGWSDGGRIRPGALADLTTISLDSVRTAGVDEAHAVDAAVFAATAADVHHVVVDGRVVVRDGRHLTVDVASELAAAVAECLP